VSSHAHTGNWTWNMEVGIVLRNVRNTEKINPIWRDNIEECGWMLQGLKTVTIQRPLTNRTNFRGGDSVKKFFSFRTTEFEVSETWKLTSQRIVDNASRHTRGRDVILGDIYRTLHSELEKETSVNSDAFFFLTVAVTESGQGLCLLTQRTKKMK
jgi:hypothetical protein